LFEVDYQVYNNDVVIKAKGYKSFDNIPVSVRGVVKHFSYKSKRRLVFKMRNLPKDFKYMITLTYPGDYEHDGKKVKKHLHSFLESIKKIWKNFKFFWILEFQKRGAPHFHLVTNCQYIMFFKSCISFLWTNIIGGGLDSFNAGTRVERVKKSLTAYFAKYFEKFEQKTVPPDYENVGRFWGISRYLILSDNFNFKSASDKFSPLRSVRLLRRFFQNKCRDWGFKWRFSGQKGFTLINGAKVFEGLINQVFRSYKIDGVLFNGMPFIENSKVNDVFVNVAF